MALIFNQLLYCYKIKQSPAVGSCHSNLLFDWSWCRSYFLSQTNSWIKGPIFIRPKVGANNSIFTWFFVYDKKLGCVCWALRYRDHDTSRCQNEISWPLFWNNRKANNGLCIVARNLRTQYSKPNLIVTSQVWPLSPTTES